MSDWLLCQFLYWRDIGSPAHNLVCHGLDHSWRRLAGVVLFSCTTYRWKNRYRFGNRSKDVYGPNVSMPCGSHWRSSRMFNQLIIRCSRYQSELCQSPRRGRLVSAEVMFVGIGIAFAYWWDFAFSFVGGPFAWRWPIAFQAIFAIWVIFVVFGIPESPRWLLKHGHKEEALEVLSAIYDKPVDHPEIIQEASSVEQALSMETEVEGSSSWASTFRRDKVSTRFRVFLAWFVQFMNQMGGINLVVYYITSQSRLLRSICLKIVFCD